MNARRSAVVLGLLLSLLRSSSTPAQAPSAEESFRIGKQLMAEGQFARACASFEDSQRRDPKVTTLLNLADCREKNQQLATAWRLFLQVLEPAPGGDEAMVRVARERAAALEPRLSMLTIAVPDASRVPAMTIELDGAPVEPGRWGIPIPVDGGEHHLRARAPGFAEVGTSIRTRAEGGRDTVTFPRERLRDAPGGPETPATPSTCVPDCRRGYTCEAGVCVAADRRTTPEHPAAAPRSAPRYQIAFGSNLASLLTGSDAPDADMLEPGTYYGRRSTAFGGRVLIRERPRLWMGIELHYTLIHHTRVESMGWSSGDTGGFLIAAEQVYRIPLGRPAWSKLLDYEISLDLSAGPYIILPDFRDAGIQAGARLSLFWFELGPTFSYGYNSELGVGLSSGAHVAF